MDRPKVPLAKGMDNRLSKRIELDADVELSVAGSRCRGQAQNLSEGGVYVTTVEEFPSTEGGLSLTFTLPGSMTPVEARGEVRWHRDLSSSGGGSGYGIRFVGLSGPMLEEIRNFVAPRPSIGQSESDVGN